MEALTTFLPIIEGSLSIFNVFMLFSLWQLKQEVEREKKYNSEFIRREEINNKELNTVIFQLQKEFNQRLLKIEMGLAKRWSTWK